MKFTDLDQSLGKHIDTMTDLTIQLKNMGAKIADAHAIGILLQCIEEPAMLRCVAAIRASVKNETTWKDVTKKLLVEYNALRGQIEIHKEIATAASAIYPKKRCDICRRTNHSTPNSFQNPDNPNNKLGQNRSTSTNDVSKIPKF